jgi:Domain of unknown function (DUF6883)
VRGVTWPPKPGERLPRAEEAVNVHEKLSDYSLNMAHKDGGPKARGFERILGITIVDIDYLEAAILDGISETPIGSVRDNPPYGYNCVVDFALGGRGEKSERVAELRTVWRIAEAGSPPHMTTAYLKP